MRAANQLVARVLEALRPLVVPGRDDGGRSTREAERLVRDAGRRAGVQGLSRVSGDGVRLGQRRGGARHPVGRAALREGDILSLDMGVKLDGFYGDCAVTLPVGRIAPEAERLLVVTQDALARGIAQVRVGGRVSDIGHAVQAHVEAHGYSVVREFVGHGIGAAAPRGAAGAELRAGGTRAAAGGGHGAGHRADGQHGQGRR